MLRLAIALHHRWRLCLVLLCGVIVSWELLAFIRCYPNYHGDTNPYDPYGAIPWGCLIQGPVSASNRLWHFLAHHSEAIFAGVTAVSTLAIAWFTSTLWQATTQQAKLPREAIELGNKEFIATHRPRLILRDAFSLISDPLDSKIMVIYTITNVGASDCWVTEAHIGIEFYERDRLSDFHDDS
jgi:hypothetical protein